MERINTLSKLSLLISVFSLICCSKTSENKTPAKADNPNRCKITDVGEAADFIQSKVIKDDVLIVAHGLGNPQALVWRDEKTNKHFYLARVMGTQKKLYYLKEVKENETPGVPSRFEGHFLRWDHLPKERAQDMMGGLKAQYNVTLIPNETYIIIKGQKPDGC